MIELRNITKKYGSLTVYDNFSLSLEEGKITCILGESGCGKTTLLNMLAGVCPYEGEITPRQPCSYIFQQPRLVPNLTVAGNLSLVCKDRARIADMLSRAGLSEKAGAYPVELLGGQAQRVSVARAFLNPARLILMDEPFSSLDTALKIRMIGLFCEIWREEKRTAVFVTHDAEEAQMLAHRAIVMREGRVVADIAARGEPPRSYGEQSSFRGELVAAMLSGEQTAII